MRYWRNVHSVIKEADLIIEVADARMPDLSRNRKAEEIVRKNGKKLVVVFNKRDLVSDRFVSRVKKDIKDCFFVSVKEGRGIQDLRRALQIMAKKSKFPKFRIGFVGYPNTGKSSLINALVRKVKTKVSRKAGTTKGIQWVSFSNIKILDSPGVIPNDEWDEVKLGIAGVKDVEKIKNLEDVAIEIIGMFLSRNPGKLGRHYGVKIKGDEYDVLEEIGRKKGHLLKRGLVDEKRTCKLIVKDWQKGKLRL